MTSLNLSWGQILRTHTQDTECALPQACCVMETLLPYLGWWNHTFCVSVLDCAMRGLGEVISKIVCTLRIVEELTSFCGALRSLLHFSS